MGVIVNGAAAATHTIGFLAHMSLFKAGLQGEKGVWGTPTGTDADPSLLSTYCVIQLIIWPINMLVRIPAVLDGGAPIFVRGSMALFAAAYAILSYAAIAWKTQTDHLANGEADKLELDKYSQAFMFYGIGAAFFLAGLSWIKFNVLPAAGVNTFTAALFFLYCGTLNFLICAFVGSNKLKAIFDGKTDGADFPSIAFEEYDFANGHAMFSIGMSLLAWDAFGKLKAADAK